MTPSIIRLSLIASAGLALALAIIHRAQRTDGRLESGQPVATRPVQEASPPHRDWLRLHHRERNPGLTPAPDPRWEVWRHGLSDLAAETDPMRREEYLTGLIEQIAFPEIPGFLGWLLTQTDLEWSSTVAERLIRRWAAQDPEAAIAWARSLPETETSPPLLSAGVLGWADNDLDAAVAWAQQLPPSRQRDQVWGLLGYELARTSPVEALRLAVELADEPERGRLIDHCLAQWASIDVAAAHAWAGAIADTALRDSAQATVATAWAEADPRAAAWLAVEGIQPGEHQDRAVVAVLQRWSQMDAAAAHAWLDRFPSGALRDSAQVALNSVSPTQDKDPVDLSP
jgi:hypothetical protein